MPSIINSVEDQPIVFNAFLEHISLNELEDTFQAMVHYIKRSGQIWLILDLTCWKMTKIDLAGLVGALASRREGSPYDHNVVTLLISNDDVIIALLESLADHNANFEMVPFPSLDSAYQFALAQWKDSKNLLN